MNRKFIKENKKTIKEFLGKFLSNVLTKRSNKALTKAIESDPTMKSRSDKIIKLGNQISQRLDKMEKDNPELKSVVDKLRRAYLS
jgi:hypothetical protein|tara:strand:- start:2435 stop:2689 length:255 start_codon:yes stop_codon:yes gene_type:complete